MGLGKWIASKGVWYFLAVVAAYSVMAFFGIVPEEIKSMLDWVNRNTTAFVIAICFIVACWAYVKTKKKGE
jgi:hypothetical protein